jgi:hypothetical protein
MSGQGAGRYAWEAVAEQHLALYRELATDNPRSIF